MKILIANDERDESVAARAGVAYGTTSYIFDVSDLDNPRFLGRYVSQSPAIDHNLYTLKNPVSGDDLVVEANYRSGTRILTTFGIEQGRMQEAAFFDMIPDGDEPMFSGTWSSYVDFPSGNIVVTDIGNGLYVLRPDWAAIARTRLDRTAPGCGQAPGTGTHLDPSTCAAEAR